MNQSIPFLASRVTRVRQQDYAAQPSIVFPLHGFRDEQEWAVGWEPEMVFPPDGEPVEGAVFMVRRGGVDEVWVLTVWDPVRGRAAYVHVTPGRDVTDIRIQVSGPECGPTHVEVTYTWTALSPDGNAFVQAQTEDDFSQWMAEWEEEMAHYLRTGTKLERPAVPGGC